MSDATASRPLRIGLVVEGATDGIVLRAAISSLLPNRELEFTIIQPDFSVALGGTGEGWSGVYRWCRQAAIEGEGSVSGSIALLNHDVIVIQIDADAAEDTYQKQKLYYEAAADLPCVKPCPPADATTNALRHVVLRWMNEPTLPPKCVFCTPSKNMEAWVMQALYPENIHVKSPRWECHASPEGQLGQQPKISRIAKTRRDYESRRPQLTAAWPQVCRLSEAQRFSDAFLTAVGL